MALDEIRVDQGLVNTQDPSTLAKGELIRAEDCFYKPSDPALWMVFGREVFNTSAISGAMKGARGLEFADGHITFVAYNGTDYYTADAGLTGAFTAAGLGLNGLGTTLDSVYTPTGDTHVLLNGSDRQRTFSHVGASHVFGYLGMLANVAGPAILLTGVGTGFTLTANAVIRYWVEERVKDSAGTIVKRNSAPERTLSELTGTGALVKPVVQRPTVVNPDATHWALFATATNGAWPTGAEIAEVVIGTDSIEDTRTGTDPGLPAGGTYSTVAVSLAGLTVTTPKYGPPPISDTGDIFEDSLMMNDKSNPLFVWYSFFNDIHAIPAINVIRIPAKTNDKVIGISSLDNFAVVLLRDSLWRINTLPRPDDGAFSGERVRAQIEGAHGCTGPKAFTKFSFGTGLRIAYVSVYGIVVTDGRDWGVLTGDFDWEGQVELSQLSKAVLINWPRFYLLELRYTPKGGTRNTKKLFLHYHPSHSKPGRTGDLRAKITGPINQDANDAFVTTISGVKELFDAHENGRLYRCHTGGVEPVATGGLKMRVLTPDRYPAGVGKEVSLLSLRTHHQAAPGQTAFVRVVQRMEGQADEDAAGDTIALDRREATAIHVGAHAEAYQFGFEAAGTSGTTALDYFIADFDMPMGAR